MSRNSTNSSRASSFDPFVYYKKLTRCLADKNSCKVNLGNIPGARKNNKMARPLITRQEIQAKFIAKCNAERKERELKEAKTSQGNHQDSQDSQSNPLNFKLNGDLKGRKRAPDYINLPPTFFSSFNGPDLSIFKQPEVPALKKKKDPEPTPPSVATSNNSTMATVNSAVFIPKEKDASTPIDQDHKKPNEKKKPFITDPDDILANFRKPMEFALKPTSEEDFTGVKSKSYLELVDETAKNIDAKCFSDQPDPFDAIQSRVLQIYEAFCESPRLLNETLMSNVSAESSPPSPVKHYSLPVPQFHENDHSEQREKDDPRVPKTCDIFNYSPCDDVEMPDVQPDCNDFSPKFDLESSILSPDNFFFDSPALTLVPEETVSRAASPDFLFSQEIGSPPNMSFDDTMQSAAHDDTFEMFTSSPIEDMSWEEPLDNTFAVFRSPPAEHSKRHSQRNRHFGASQRSQKKDSQRSRHPDSSLSTYKWSPNFGSDKKLDTSTYSSHSTSYPFKPRNFFKDSFDAL